MRLLVNESCIQTARASALIGTNGNILWFKGELWEPFSVWFDLERSWDNLHFPWNSRADLHITFAIQTTNRLQNIYRKVYQLFHEGEGTSTSVSWDFPFSVGHGTYGECSNLLLTVVCTLRLNVAHVICFIPLRSFSRNSKKGSHEEILTNKFCLKNVSSLDNVLFFQQYRLMQKFKLSCLECLAPEVELTCIIPFLALKKRDSCN